MEIRDQGPRRRVSGMMNQSMEHQPNAGPRSIRETEDSLANRVSEQLQAFYESTSTVLNEVVVNLGFGHPPRSGRHSAGPNLPLFFAVWSLALLYW